MDPLFAIDHEGANGAFIQDIRTAKEFSNASFTGHRKSAVRTALRTALRESKVETACYWSVELICAGHFDDLWEALIDFFIHHVHTANVKLIIFMRNQRDIFATFIEEKGYVHNPLGLRNEPKVRILLGRVVFMLAESRQGRMLKETTTPFSELELETLLNCPETADTRFHAPNTSFADRVFAHDGDPIELFVALNELIFAISDSERECGQALFWLEWMLSYDRARHSRDCTDEPLTAVCRNWATTDLARQSDPVWIAWDACIQEAEQRRATPLIAHAVRAAHALFAEGHRRSNIKRRRGLIYFAVTLLTETITNVPAVRDEAHMMAVLPGILHHVYTQVRASEVRVKPQSEGSGIWQR